jgi:hypothetical protein
MSHLHLISAVVFLFLSNLSILFFFKQKKIYKNKKDKKLGGRKPDPATSKLALKGITT